MGELINLIKSLFMNQTETSDANYFPNHQPVPRVNRQLKSQRNDRRNDRVEKEILMIAPRFASSGGIFYDDENKDWLMIPRYPLPERWEERWSKLMIIFPNTYPNTPPIGFYLNKKFNLKNGQDNHFTGSAHHGAPDLLKQGWHWYCVTMKNDSQGGWNPSADHTKPDNLWTFLNMVRESLTNDF
jgi:hypothetical protein